MRKIGIAVFLSIILTISIAGAQPRTLDKIAAVIGSSIVLKSDIELRYANYLASGGQPADAIKCEITQSLSHKNYWPNRQLLIALL